MTWDRRFALDLVATGKGPRGTAWVSRLGRDGWAGIVQESPDLRQSPIPLLARVTLPALWDDDGVFAVPHLQYQRQALAKPGVAVGRVAFRPPNTLSGTGFFLA